MAQTEPGWSPGRIPLPWSGVDPRPHNSSLEGRLGGGDPLQRPGQRVPRAGWAMQARWPEPEMRQNLPDDLGLLDDGDDPHWSRTPGAEEPIHLVDLLDEPGPGPFRN